MDLELIYSWGIGLTIILFFLVTYVRNLRKKETSTRNRLRHTMSTGADKPMMQHPIINKSTCIGCGICTQVCPEGDVLGLIDGKSTIVNGSLCVGHALCADNCPVGAIVIGLGDISEREDIPFLSPEFESNILGIYIVGELSGIALIRNAIERGVAAVDAIKDKLSSDDSHDFSLIIIGAGPAGIASALRAIELGIDYLLIDQYEPGGTILQYPRRKLTLVQPVTLPLYGTLSKKEYLKEELLEIWYDVIDKQNINLKTGYKLTAVEGSDNKFLIKTSNGNFSAKKIILSLGRRGTPRKLGIQGEDLSHVMYKLIDAETYKNQKLLIVGGGDSAIEAAIALASQEGNDVTLSYRKEAFFRIKSRNEININKYIEEKKLKVIFNSNVVDIAPDLVKIKIGSKIKSLEYDYVFILTGGELPFPLLKEIGINFGQKIDAKN